MIIYFKKYVVAVLIGVLIFCFAGCEMVETDAGTVKRTVYNTRPEMECSNGLDMFSNWSYAIDKSTGVVYIVYRTSEKFAITVALNADGTPVTAKQLEIDGY